MAFTPDRHIAFYVHHHGSGHLRRAEAIASCLEPPVTIFSSLVTDHQAGAIQYRALAPDHHDDVKPEAFELFHYAPLMVSGIRSRMAAMSQWFADHWPCVLIVDVSVEVATLARLCGVPVIYVRQRGQRRDAAHEHAYATAARLLAPYPQSWEPPDVPLHRRQKTDYVGLISRYENKLCPRNASLAPARRSVAVLAGFGGTRLGAIYLIEAAKASSEWDWVVVGPIGRPNGLEATENIRFMGAVDDPLEILLQADVVIGSAGDSVVSEIAHLHLRFICLPEDRPFNEQVETARMLDATGQAIVQYDLPDPQEWRPLLDHALSSGAYRWLDVEKGGAAHAAGHIERTVQQLLNGSVRERSGWTS